MSKFEKRYVAPPQWDLGRIESFGTDVSWAIGFGQLLKTEDRGKSWKNLYKSPPFHSGTVPRRIAFHSTTEGLLIAKRIPEVIYFRTENGGRDWFQVHRVARGIWAELSTPRHSKKAWGLIKAGGEPAFVEIVTGDDGKWKRVNTAISGEVCDIVFANELTGWILERWNENSWIEGSPAVDRTTTVLHRSADGGNKWSVISKKEHSMSRLVAVDERKLFAAGEDGIFVSEDSGVNWRQVIDKPRVPLLDIHFLGATGAVIGTDGLIESKKDVLMMVSRNGGESWNEVELPEAEAFFGIRMMTWSSGILASCNSLYTFELT